MVSGVGGPRAIRRGLDVGGVDDLEGAGGADPTQDVQGVDQDPIQDPQGVSGVGGPDAAGKTGPAFFEDSFAGSISMTNKDGTSMSLGPGGVTSPSSSATSAMDRGLAAQGVLGQDGADPAAADNMRFDFFMKRKEFEWWLGDEQPWKDTTPDLGGLKKGLAELQQQMNSDNNNSSTEGAKDTAMTDPSLVDPAMRMQKDIERTLEQQRRMGLGGVVAGRYDDPTRR